MYSTEIPPTTSTGFEGNLSSPAHGYLQNLGGRTKGLCSSLHVFYCASEGGKKESSAESSRTPAKEAGGQIHP